MIVAQPCKICSAPFSFKVRGGKPTLYCSDACRKSSWRSMDKLRRSTGRSRGRPRLDTFCQNGHRRTSKNTYIEPGGRRMCRICRSINKARYLTRKRERDGQAPSLVCTPV